MNDFFGFRIYYIILLIYIKTRCNDRNCDGLAQSLIFTDPHNDIGPKTSLILNMVINLTYFIYRNFLSTGNDKQQYIFCTSNFIVVQQGGIQRLHYGLMCPGGA